MYFSYHDSQTSSHQLPFCLHCRSHWITAHHASFPFQKSVTHTTGLEPDAYSRTAALVRSFPGSTKRHRQMLRQVPNIKFFHSRHCPSCPPFFPRAVAGSHHLSL